MAGRALRKDLKELIQTLPLRDQLRVARILLRIRVKCLRIAKLIEGMFLQPMALSIPSLPARRPCQAMSVRSEMKVTRCEAFHSAASPSAAMFLCQRARQEPS
jgi:hypothetical protein